MGTKRLGLARVEALIEGLNSRSLDLTSTTLTDCIITTSAAATFSGTTQNVGKGSNSTLFNYTSLAAESTGYGVYDLIAETDFGSSTSSATDNGLIKTVCTIPADSMITECRYIVSEVFGHNNTNTTDLVTATTADTDTLDEAVTAVATLFDGLTLKSSGNGALGTIGEAVFSGTTAHNVVTSGTSTTLAWINKGTGNGTAATVSGKVVVFLRYIGTAAPAIDVRV